MIDKEREGSSEQPPNLSFNALMQQKRRRSGSYHDENLFSQTPLDIQLNIDGSLYKDAAWVYLSHILDDMQQRTQLPQVIIDQIWVEMLLEHERRCEGSEKALRRLAGELEGKILSFEDHALLEKVLSGDASLTESGLCLLKFPVMQSLEAVKYTNPVDPAAEGSVTRHVMMQLGEISDDPSMMVDIYAADDERRQTRFINTRDLSVDNVVCTKENVAEISDGNAVAQLIHKCSQILIPKGVHVRGVEPRIIDVDRGENGKDEINLQTVTHSFYWRITDKIDGVFPRY